MKILYWIWICCCLFSFSACANTTSDYCSNLQSSDGTLYNLQTLTEKGQIAMSFRDPNNYSYSISVSLCSTSIDCEGSKEAVCICELNDQGTCARLKWPFGEFSTSGVTPLDNGEGVKIRYQGSMYYTEISLLCDYNSVGVQNYNASFVKVSGRNKGATAVIYTEAACPINSPISGGTIFMFVVLGAAVLYIVIGILVNKFSFMKQGREVVPNVDFWSDLPFLVKDGGVFMVAKIRGRSAHFENV